MEVITHCHEQRVSGLAQAVLIGLTLCALTVLGYIPIAALDGLFIYMGIASFGGNSFYQRLVLFITDPCSCHLHRVGNSGAFHYLDSKVGVRFKCGKDSLEDVKHLLPHTRRHRSEHIHVRVEVERNYVSE